MKIFNRQPFEKRYSFNVRLQNSVRSQYKNLNVQVDELDDEDDEQQQQVGSPVVLQPDLNKVSQSTLMNVRSHKRYSSLQRGIYKYKPMGYDIPGRDHPLGKNFIERVSEETMREYQSERL